MDGNHLGTAILTSQLSVNLNGRDVLRDLSVRVRSGEVFGLIGASGSGKTVLMRTMLGLLPMSHGSVVVLGRQLGETDPNSVRQLGGRVGTLFQHGALFSSLSVCENVEFPMREYLSGSPRMFREVAYAKLQMVGIMPEDGSKMPSELSGGMTKRVALARALALDPELLFLDEPTSGLDPIAAGEFNALIRTLRATLNLTVFMITHDLQTLRTLCDRVAALYDGEIIAEGSYDAVAASKHAWLQAYFHDGATPQVPGAV